MGSGLRVPVVVAWLVLIVCGIAAGVTMHRLWQLRSEVEQLDTRLTLDVGPESTLLFDSSDHLFSAVYEEHRMRVPLGEISPHLVAAVLATEDRRFYDHDGIDPLRILAAFVANQRAGEIVEGGSTITQQLVRAILLDRSRTYSRKLKEAILALRVEERYSKQQILEAYLNRVYFGDGYYGVEAAARGYFGKAVAALDVAEAATLAALIKGPSIYSPTKHPDACRRRRDLVLQEMHSLGVLSDTEYRAAVAVPVKALLASATANTGAADPRRARGAEYFRDAVTRELVQRFGAEAVYTGGLRVYTTLDRSLQDLAEQAIASRLGRFDEQLQGALVAIDPQTGFVKALVGGREYRTSQYNRALDARRQPGSAFKPFIYAVALESGYTPGSLVDHLDAPIPTPQGPWLPRGEHELTSTTLRTGLALSSNRAAAHLLQQVGVHRTLDLVQRLGVTSPLPPVPALALGAGEVTLYELTSAYGAFANRGGWRSPTMIRRVLDRGGREIYAAATTGRTVMSEATAYMMASMMSDVLSYGSAATARKQGLHVRAAGKTGTSQDYTDAWFVGFTPSLVSGVWFGYDQPRPIMERGFASAVAVPAWAQFMSAALRGREDRWPAMPAALTTVRICKLSGGLATERCNEPIYEPAPYDSWEFEAGAPVRVRASAVYQEVMPADRLPPPCTLPHGVHAYILPVDPHVDPNRPVPVPVPDRASTVDPLPMPPPSFMTDRPPRVTTLDSAPREITPRVTAPPAEQRIAPASPPVLAPPAAVPENPIVPPEFEPSRVPPPPPPVAPRVAPPRPADPLAPIVPGARPRRPPGG